jgi:hypothetical protein
LHDLPAFAPVGSFGEGRHCRCHHDDSDSEQRFTNPYIHNRPSTLRNPKSIRNPQSEIRDPKSEIV